MLRPQDRRQDRGLNLPARRPRGDRCALEPARGRLLRDRPAHGADFDAEVAAKSYFEPEALALAFRRGRLRALVHAGFKSADHNRATGERMAVVSHVAVSPAVQGKGAAAGLQGEVHRLLREEGARTMGLGTGGASIHDISFYRRLGYHRDSITQRAGPARRRMGPRPTSTGRGGS